MILSSCNVALKKIVPIHLNDLATDLLATSGLFDRGQFSEPTKQLFVKRRYLSVFEPLRIVLNMQYVFQIETNTFPKIISTTKFLLHKILLSQEKRSP